MVLKKEYRICMPLTVEEYQIGQLYMIARHSNEESVSGDGVEVVANKPCEDPVHGKGQYTEKKLHLSNRLPFWIQSVLPRVFYVIEKSWNYYPYTVTEYTCSFLQRFHILIKTRFENNNGSSENCIGLSAEELMNRTVDYIDIAYDDINPRKYKEEEDPKYFQSKITGRGPLVEGWRDSVQPIMCSYKYVQVSFEVWGLQSKVEDLIQKAIRDVLLLGHRQAFTWIDEWYGMSITDVRIYECQMQRQTNEIVMREAEEEEKRGTPAEGAGDSVSNVNSLIGQVRQK
ncbi:UNVERIFIED_CONTAM: hypothetical protein PYX00_005498 [Menopon gallinae]|uniref:Phosphatidylinositol transfer protein N-terminal domain-containing protein n=1 Tax=Menopon gallinae TaxID=328185 RepID=A0AAW2HSK0_9NEOP